MARPYVFISHSSQDKSFVRKLDVSLASAGADVFLDERNIRIGESIPNSVFSAIGRATHVICVLSEASISSKWVADELGAARMLRNRPESVVAILPVRIDDSPIPADLLHLKYGDFRRWNDAAEYTRALRRLFEAVGVSLPVPVPSDLRAFVAHYGTLNEAEVTAVRTGAVIDGVLDAMFSADRGVEPRWYGLEAVIKWHFIYETDHLEVFREAEACIEDYQRGVLEDAKRVLSILLIDLDTDRVKKYRRDYYYWPEIRDRAFRLAGLLRSWRLDVTSILVAGLAVPMTDSEQT
jgi:hypothetical protein